MNVTKNHHKNRIHGIYSGSRPPFHREGTLFSSSRKRPKKEYVAKVVGLKSSISYYQIAAPIKRARIGAQCAAGYPQESEPQRGAEGALWGG